MSLRLQIPLIQGHKNKKLPYLLQDTGDFIFFGARDGTFFFQGRPDFQSDARFEKLLATKSQIVGFFPDSFHSSVSLRLQGPLSFVHKENKNSRFYVSCLIFFGARDGTWTHTPFGIRTSSVRVYHSTTRAGVKKFLFYWGCLSLVKYRETKVFECKSSTWSETVQQSTVSEGTEI